jgi:membrane protease YdiL (CAAX protease family)
MIAAAASNTFGTIPVREVPVSLDDSTSAINPPTPSRLRRVFFGPAELRAGWRLLIFLGVLPLSLGVIVLVVLAVRGRAAQESLPVLNDLLTSSIVLVATAVMAIFERRRLADYGLPLRQCLGEKFWAGVLVGLATMTTLMAAMHLAGVVSLSKGTAQGSALVTYAVFAAVGFVFGAAFEELLCRGYLLFTLTTGLGFWPAAVLSSTLFAVLHRLNPGETWFGCFSTGVFGLLLCVILRRTGNLWMPIGFHASYNWAESFFYGTPDSGILARERFLTAEFSGSKWLTGGSAGPEGSALCVALIVLITIAFGLWRRTAKYPDPTALRTASAETVAAAD